MESLVEGISSLPNSRTPFTAIKGNTSSASRTSRPPHPTSMRQSRCKELSFDPIAIDIGSKLTDTPTGSVAASKSLHKSSSDRIKRDDVSGSRRHYSESTKEKECQSIEDALDQPSEECSLDRVLIFETKSSIKDPLHDNKHTTPGGYVERRDFMLHAVARGDADLLNGQLTSQSGISYCPSPQNSFYTATQYIEPKQSFSTTEVISECASSMGKSGGSGNVSNSCDISDSRKTSFYRGSTGSDISDESSSTSVGSTMYKPHQANDTRWDAIQAIRSIDGTLGFNHFRLLKRLGGGDIGNVFLAELIGTRDYFAMKVMDNAALESRKKTVRAQTEREILQSLDHPFLPTLYSHFETDKFSCLVMEFCPGGDLHALRQRQPGKFFPEHAARLG